MYLSAEHKLDMVKYWMLVRGTPQYARVGELMLWWLSHPVGTAGVERDFCGLTMITRAFRRNRMGFTALRAALLAHCHKPLLRTELGVELRRCALRT